jgi:hypothetical protein
MLLLIVLLMLSAHTANSHSINYQLNDVASRQLKITMSDLPEQEKNQVLEEPNAIVQGQRGGFNRCEEMNRQAPNIEGARQAVENCLRKNYPQWNSSDLRVEIIRAEGLCLTVRCDENTVRQDSILITLIAHPSSSRISQTRISEFVQGINNSIKARNGKLMGYPAFARDSI